MYYTVYKTTCLVNNKIYIGKHQTKNLNDGYLGSGKSLLRAVNKYGKENFKVERILLNNEEEMNELEAFIVDEEFVSRKDTYNITLGGFGGFFYINSSGLNIVKGRYYSPEARKKMSLANKGRKLSENHKKKISDNNELTNISRGRKVSENFRRKKLSGDYEAVRLSEEHKRKISESLTGRIIKINKNKSIEKQNPEIASLWHPTKNNDLRPSMISSKSDKKVWWLCENNHSHKKSIRSQIKCSQCPICNSMGYRFPKIAKLWHPTKNETLTPFDFAKYSSKKVWWICDKGHEYEQRIDDKTYKGYGCPKCSGRK